VSGPRAFDDLNMSPEGEAYLKWFHENKVWKGMTWHGVRTLKLPSDVWNYQEIIFDYRIEHVIETERGMGVRRCSSPRRSRRAARGARHFHRRGSGANLLAASSRNPFPDRRQRCVPMVERALGLLPATRADLPDPRFGPFAGTRAA
jgi:hypothetical protein